MNRNPIEGDTRENDMRDDPKGLKWQKWLHNVQKDNKKMSKLPKTHSKGIFFCVFPRWLIRFIGESGWVDGSPKDVWWVRCKDAPTSFGRGLRRHVFDAGKAVRGTIVMSRGVGGKRGKAHVGFALQARSSGAGHDDHLGQKRRLDADKQLRRDR